MGISFAGMKIEPAPFVRLSKNYVTTEDGTPIGSTFNITLEGTLLPYKGSPTSSGTFWVTGGTTVDETNLSSTDWMQSLIGKQEALRRLFSYQGSGLQIDGFDGYSYLQCNPRIKNVEFPAGNPVSWAHKCQYSIDLEADVVYLAHGNTITEDTGVVSGFKIQSAEESWDIESVDENQPLFRLSHRVSAKGKKHYNTQGVLAQPAWQNARDYVLTRLGINYDRLYASGVLNLLGFSGYNYVRTTSQNDTGGLFTVSENWLCFAPGTGTPYHAYEEYDVNLREDEGGLTSVTLAGKVQGLEVRKNTTRGPVESTKYYNASGQFNSIASSFQTRAETYAGLTLNPIPLGKSIGRNPLTGVINYSVEYNNRPTPTISGARSQKVSLSYQNQTDVFAELIILGRAAGPIFQDIGTKTARTKTVNVELVMSGKTMSATPTEPDTNSLISGYYPSATWVKTTSDSRNWDENTGRYSRSVTWKYGS